MKYLPPDRHEGAVKTAAVYCMGSHRNGTAPEELQEVATGYKMDHIGTLVEIAPEQIVQRSP
jgi:hypothetical protein